MRNLPPEVVRLVQRRAREKKMSIGKAVIELLEECASVTKKSRQALSDDLDHLAGRWTQEETAAFEQALKGQRTMR